MPDHTLEIFCSSCERNITMEEARNGTHVSHQFSNSERTALMYVSEYLQSLKATA